MQGVWQCVFAEPAQLGVRHLKHVVVHQDQARLHIDRGGRRGGWLVVAAPSGPKLFQICLHRLDLLRVLGCVAGWRVLEVEKADGHGLEPALRAQQLAVGGSGLRLEEDSQLGWLRGLLGRSRERRSHFREKEWRALCWRLNV